MYPTNELILFFILVIQPERTVYFAALSFQLVLAKKMGEKNYKPEC